MLNDVKIILWDFDGVLMDSNAVRDLGFQQVLAGYPDNQVDALMKYHKANGGLSRYVKFRYFFEVILKQKVSDEQVQSMSQSFSTIMRRLLVNADLLIWDSIQFVAANYQKIGMHIVSGSDEQELQYLCTELGIDHYFLSIHGSPTPKKELVATLLEKYQYPKDDVVLIGDSINDLEAASVNGLRFTGYNNEQLKAHADNYIYSFANYTA